MFHLSSEIISVLLVITLISFFIGLFWGKYLGSRPEKRAKESQVAFLDGFRYMLSNEPDRAIESFMKAVRLDTDTIETYFALANLFRDKGEIERAIRIHQSIITRPHLDQNIRLQALYDLAMDYKKGGFLDRAIKTFKEVIRRAPHKQEAYLELAEIYQMLKDWNSASEIIEKLAKITKQDYSLTLAHFQTEEGKRLELEAERVLETEQGSEARQRALEKIEEAAQCYKKALKINEQCIDAYLHLGDLHLKRGEIKNALKIWLKAIKIAPDYSFLIFSRLEKHLPQFKEHKFFKKFIKELEKNEGLNVFSLIFLAKYYLDENQLQKAEEYLLNASKINSSINIQKLLAQVYLKEGKNTQAAQILEKISHEVFSQNIYQCQECGYEASELSWKCPQCQKWDTMKLKF